MISLFTKVSGEPGPGHVPSGLRTWRTAHVLFVSNRTENLPPELICR